MKLIFENWRNFRRLNEGVDPRTIEKIESAIRDSGGESYIVGGAVRDELIPNTPESKDVDFLIRNLTYDQIKNSIQHLGKVSEEVGATFGVLTATIDGEEFDFAIPRTSETKTGEKHSDFQVTLDPTAPIESDLSRRDFTINALAKDSQGNIIDMFGGQEDIKAGVIRAVGNADERFAEDPLRMFRALQFATRFDFTIEDETAAAIRNNLDKLDTVAGQRILIELGKAWTKGSANSARLIELLQSTGVGKQIFGEDFDPLPVNIRHGDKMLGNAMAFFVNGGDYMKLKPTTKMIEHIKMIRLAVRGEELLNYVRRNTNQRGSLTLLGEVLEQIGYHNIAANIKHVLDSNLPLTVKELAIGGRELVQSGYKGAEIGRAQAMILQAVHAGEVSNSYDDILDFLEDR